MIQIPDSIIQRTEDQLRGVLISGKLAEGSQILELEDQVKNMHSSLPHVIAVNSCGAGIFAVLKSIIDPDNRTSVSIFIQENTMYGVWTTARLCCSNLLSIKCKNLIMDPEALEDRLSKNNCENKIVIYSHIGGSVVHDNIAKIAAICIKYRATLIEDCAHTLCAQDTIYGLAGIYSMYATKAVPAGEGGLIVTNSLYLADYLRRFIKYDRVRMEMSVGLNLRVSEVQALLMNNVLRHHDEILADRFNTLTIYLNYCNILGIEVLDTNYRQHNGYKFIITDKRCIEYAQSQIPKCNADGSVPEYDGDGILTGTVFGYRISDYGNVGHLKIPDHICLNTNYLLDPDTINRTLDWLSESIGIPVSGGTS